MRFLCPVLAVLIASAITIAVASGEQLTSSCRITAVDSAAHTVTLVRKMASGEKTGVAKVAATAKITLAGKAGELSNLAVPLDANIVYDTNQRAVVEIEIASIPGSEGSEPRRTALASKPWLGYVVHQDSARAVDAVVDHSNVIIDTSWPRLSDDCLDAARRAKLKVVLAIESDYVASIESRGIPLLKKYSDVVQAIYLVSANANGLPDHDITSLGQKIKQASPETQLWVGYPAHPGAKTSTDPAPQEVDALVVEIHFAKTPLLVERHGNDSIPTLMQRAKGRPLILMWTSWTQEPPGLVPDCELGVFKKCEELVSTFHLAGLIFDSYGRRPLPKGAGQGIETRTDLVSEMRGISRRLGIEKP